MIERILVAQRALADGRLDQAELLFRQVADADERNAIAVVGLAEVALARGDPEAARGLAERALAIDPDDAAAHRLAAHAEPRVAAEAPAGAAEPQAAPEPQVPPEPQAAPESQPSMARPSILRRLVATIRRLLGQGGGPPDTLGI